MEGSKRRISLDRARSETKKDNIVSRSSNAIDGPKRDPDTCKMVTEVDLLMDKIATNIKPDITRSESPHITTQNSVGCKAKKPVELSHAVSTPASCAHEAQHVSTRTSSKRASATAKASADPPRPRSRAPPTHAAAQEIPTPLAKTADPSSTDALSSGASKAQQASHARRSSVPALPSAAELNRKFSFADCSIAQLRDRIVAEEPGIAFHVGFWHAVLSSSFAPGFRPLQNRTLSFWVQTFNKWQHLRERDAQDAPEYVDGVTFGKLICLSCSKLSGVCKLFDSSRQSQSVTLSDSEMSKVRVHMPSVLVAGVMTSMYISTEHKLIFVFGLFDFNDSGALDRREFGNFIHCFVEGMVSAYGISDQTVVPPKKIAVEIANRYYDRIAKVAAQKVKHIHSISTKESKQIIEREVRKRLTRMQTCGVKDSGMTYQTLRDWCMQDTLDPLGAPYALAFQRFCSERQNCFTVVDEYDEACVKFKLCHKSPVPVPTEEKINDAELINRKEVLLVRKVFEYCSEKGTFGTDIGRIKREVKIDLPEHLEILLAQCLRSVSSKGSRSRVRLLDFFRLVCPKARPRHIRMLEDWCIQHDRNVEEARLASEMCATQQAEKAKPHLPSEDILTLKKRFQAMDGNGNGLLEPQELVEEFGFKDVESVKAMLAENDISGDSFIDEVEFLRMNCPPDYRLPDTDELATELLTVLSHKHEHAQTSVQQMRKSNHRSNTTTFTEVPDEIWKQWTELYDKLDYNGNGFVATSELNYAGVVSQDLRDYLVKDLAGESEAEHGFTKRSFLERLLEAHRWWRCGFSLSDA